MPDNQPGKLPGFTIKFQGSELENTYQVLSVQVFKMIQKIARAQIVLIAGNEFMHTFEESEATKFAPGTEVEISLGFNQNYTQVFKGEILRHAISIKRGFSSDSSKSQLLLECADKASKLTLGTNYAFFENKNDSDILTSVISGAGLSSDVDALEYVHPVMIQYDESDWDFIVRRAKANGMVVMNADAKVSVKKLTAAGSSILDLEYGTDIISFEGEIDASTQIKEVNASSWDIYQNKAISSKSAEPAAAHPAGNLTGQKLAEDAGLADWDFKYPPLHDAAELKSVADAALAFSRLHRVRGYVEFTGAASVEVGKVINLKGLGARFNGKVFVAGVEHRLSDGIFSTRVEFGLPDYLGAESQLMGPSPLVNTTHGIHIGTVKKIDGDPLSELRIQVEIKGLFKSTDLIWARMTHFYTAAAAGSYFIPEVDTEVAVGFIRNDPRYPIILGSLFNKSTQPYKPLSAENDIKAILSKNKVKLEFDDTKKALTLGTPGGNSIVLSDDEKGITIKDQNGNKIITSSDGIELKSVKDVKISGGAKVTISGATGLDIAVSGGDVNVKGLNVNAKAQVKFSANGAAQAELTASGQVTVKGAIVMIN
jgi:phage protein D